MDREELQQKLNQMLRQQPFQPFRVILTDGRTFDIRNPRMNQLARTFIKIGISAPDLKEPICDDLVYVRLTEIARTEPLPTSAQP